jgi:hypothetical protein
MVNRYHNRLRQLDLDPEVQNLPYHQKVRRLQSHQALADVEARS